MFERATPISPLDGFTLSDKEDEDDEKDRVTPYNNLVVAAPVPAQAPSSQLGPAANPFLAQIRSFKPTTNKSKGAKKSSAPPAPPRSSSLPTAGGMQRPKQGASVYNGF